MGISQSCLRAFSRGSDPLQKLAEDASGAGAGGGGFSWDKREEINLGDYTFEDIHEGEVGKMPGDIKGKFEQEVSGLVTPEGFSCFKLRT